MDRCSSVIIEELEAHCGIAARPSPEHLPLQKSDRVHAIEREKVRRLEIEKWRDVPADHILGPEDFPESKCLAVIVEKARQQRRSGACGADDDEPPVICRATDRTQIKHGSRKCLAARGRWPQDVEGAHVALALDCAKRTGRTPTWEANMR